MSTFSISILHNHLNSVSEVLKNNTQISSQNDLHLMCNNSFFQWHQNILGLIHREVNDSFSLSFSGSQLHGIILKKECDNFSACNSYSYSTPNCKITLADRLSWLEELMQFSSVNSLLSSMPVNVIVTNTALQSPVSGELQISSCCSTGASSPFRAGVHTGTSGVSGKGLRIIVTDSQNFSLSIVPNRKTVVYLVDNNIPVIQYLCINNGIYCFSGPLHSFHNFVDMCTDAILLPEIIPAVINSLKTDRNFINCSTLKIKLIPKALLSMVPICDATIPNRLELNTSKPITVAMLPGKSASLRFSVPGLLGCDGKKISGIKPGKTQLSISYDETSPPIFTQTIEVYEIFKVKSITLSCSKTTIYKNDRFTVSASFFPSNSVDISSQKWDISNRSVLTPNSDGNFTAVGSGTATITVNVGSVKSSITVTVLESAERISLPSKSVSLKVTASPMKFEPGILPSSAKNGNITCTVSNSSVADYDPYSKQIIPISEGTAYLQIVLSVNGLVKDTASVAINVLPKYRVQNPTHTLVFTIMLTIISIFTVYTILNPIVCIAAFVFAVWHMISQRFSHNSLITSLVCIAVLIVINVLIYLV